MLKQKEEKFKEFLCWFQEGWSLKWFLGLKLKQIFVLCVQEKSSNETREMKKKKLMNIFFLSLLCVQEKLSIEAWVGFFCVLCV